MFQAKQQQPHIENHATIPIKKDIPLTASDLARTHHENLVHHHQLHTSDVVHQNNPSIITKFKDLEDFNIQRSIKSRTIASVADNVLNKGAAKINDVDNFDNMNGLSKSVSDELNSLDNTKTIELTKTLSDLEQIVEKEGILHGVIFEEAYRDLKQLLQDGPYKIITTHDTKDINRLVATWGFDDPPHHVFYPAVEVVTTGPAKDLVRVFTYANDGLPSGHFLAPRSEIDGLSRSEIKYKLALDFEPTHIADANLPKDVKLFISIVGENYGQPGGGIQMQIADKLTDTQRKSWFNNVRELE